jgi:para-nitrobenzyl esterase
MTGRSASGAARARLSLTAALIASAAALLTACGGDDSPADPTLVATDKGAVKGVEGASTLKFLGIPYAAPPTGASRWTAPQAPAAWTTTRDASAFGTHCPQPDTAFGRAANSAEDCLFLNVFRPKGGGPFPVMVWIHGGAFWTGESEDYDPTPLVDQGVVVVTLNYRLGALGFLAHPALSAEGGGSSGDYGLMDQQAALAWVQANIGAFGGDKGNVTLFGESAGGASVHAQLASPLAAGLFHKAIAQSAAYTLDTPALAGAETLGQNFATAAGCNPQTAACLRALSLDQVLANQLAIIGGGGVLPNVDGKVLTETLRSALANGRFAKVPLIEGSNGNEFSLISAFYFDFTTPPAGLGPVTSQNYPTAEAITIGLYDAKKSVAEVDAVYPVASFARPIDAIDVIGTDSGFACPAREAVRAIVSSTPVYQYEFNDPNAPMIVLPSSQSHPPWGAYHTSEIQYLMGVTPMVAAPPALDATQQALAAQMVGYWTRFAKTGDPNGSGAPAWGAYSAAADTALLLQPGGATPSADFAARHHCVFWSGS